MPVLLGQILAVRRLLEGGIAGLIVSAALTTGWPAPERDATISLRASAARVPIGETTAVTALVRGDGRPVGRRALWAFVNGRRWGARAITDRHGRATFLLPMPAPGEARVQVISRSAATVAAADWIWAATTAPTQTVYFQKSFVLKGTPRRAGLVMTCDDRFHAFLNGQPIASGSDFHRAQRVTGLERWLHAGLNQLRVQSYNGAGPAGLLGRLEIVTDRGAAAVATDRTWRVFSREPEGWLASSAEPGAPARVVAPAGGGVWGADLQGWPGLAPSPDFPIGQPLPAGGARSNVLRITVQRRAIRVVCDPKHRVGIDYEPWFTPLNARWQTAEAIPLLGRYGSDDPGVIRQHALWMDAMGIDFALIDWSNNLWGLSHWREHGRGAEEIVHATLRLLDTYAQMRREGVSTPQITLLLGLDNGPAATMAALNEELQFVHDTLIRPPVYRGLWVMDEGKPLIVILNTQGRGYLARQPPLAGSAFTVRWMSARLEKNHQERDGYWSWMDGVIHPIPTYKAGAAEALTVTPAFFGDGGWTGPEARGRRGGATYLEEFRTALRVRPKFLLINQWNEFAGQADGEGYGPKHNVYVDTYNVPLSDDIEPTALAGFGYRGGAGWGFRYLNLTRALVQIYRGQAPESTLLAVASPGLGEVVSGRVLAVQWTAVGRRPRGYTLRLDGRPAAGGVVASPYSLALDGLAPGRHVLTLRADGAITRFPLSDRHEDGPARRFRPVSVSVEFDLQRTDRRAGKEVGNRAGAGPLK